MNSLIYFHLLLLNLNQSLLRWLIVLIQYYVSFEEAQDTAYDVGKDEAQDFVVVKMMN